MSLDWFRHLCRFTPSLRPPIVGTNLTTYQQRIGSIEYDAVRVRTTPAERKLRFKYGAALINVGSVNVSQTQSGIENFSLP
jgi:hypothetical protein